MQSEVICRPLSGCGQTHCHVAPGCKGPVSKQPIMGGLHQVAATRERLENIKKILAAIFAATEGPLLPFLLPVHDVDLNRSL